MYDRGFQHWTWCKKLVTEIIDVRSLKLVVKWRKPSFEQKFIVRVWINIMVPISYSYSRMSVGMYDIYGSSCFCLAVHSSGITDLSVYEQAPPKQWITIHITLCPSWIGRTTDGDFGSHYQGSGQGDSSNRNRFVIQFL